MYICMYISVNIIDEYTRVRARECVSKRHRQAPHQDRGPPPPRALTKLNSKQYARPVGRSLVAGCGCGHVPCHAAFLHLFWFKTCSALFACAAKTFAHPPTNSARALAKYKICEHASRFSPWTARTHRKTVHCLLKHRSPGQT